MTQTPIAMDLDRILAQAAGFGAGPRQVEAATAPEALGIVLDAIAACILPRRLTIADNTGPVLVAEAAGGALMRLVAVYSTQAPPPTGLMDRQLLAADLGAVAGLLSDLFPGGQLIAVSTSPVQTEADPAHPGLTCPAIMTEFDLIPFDACVPDPLAYFIEAAADVLIAVYAPGEAPLMIQPDSSLTNDLCGDLDTLVSPENPALNLLELNEILFFGLQGSADLAVGLAQLGSGPVALVIEAASLVDVAAFWANMPHVPLSAG